MISRTVLVLVALQLILHVSTMPKPLEKEGSNFDDALVDYNIDDVEHSIVKRETKDAPKKKIKAIPIVALILACIALVLAVLAVGLVFQFKPKRPSDGTKKKDNAPKKRGGPPSMKHKAPTTNAHPPLLKAQPEVKVTPASPEPAPKVESKVTASPPVSPPVKSGGTHSPRLSGSPLRSGSNEKQSGSNDKSGPSGNSALSPPLNTAEAPLSKLFRTIDG